MWTNAQGLLNLHTIWFLAVPAYTHYPGRSDTYSLDQLAIAGARGAASSWIHSPSPLEHRGNAWVNT